MTIQSTTWSQIVSNYHTPLISLNKLDSDFFLFAPLLAEIILNKKPELFEAHLQKNVGISSLDEKINILINSVHLKVPRLTKNKNGEKAILEISF